LPRLCWVSYSVLIFRVSCSYMALSKSCIHVRTHSTVLYRINTAIAALWLHRGNELNHCSVKLKFRESILLARMSACRATSPFSLPRAYLIGRPAVCCGLVLPVCRVCRVVLQIPRARHARLVADILARILVVFSSDTSDTPDFLMTC